MTLSSPCAPVSNKLISSYSHQKAVGSLHSPDYAASTVWLGEKMESYLSWSTNLTVIQLSLVISFSTHWETCVMKTPCGFMQFSGEYYLKIIHDRGKHELRICIHLPSLFFFYFGCITVGIYFKRVLITSQEWTGGTGNPSMFVKARSLNPIWCLKYIW